MKIDLPSFNRHLHIEDFLYWVTEVERFFDYICIPKDRKVKLVVYKFKGGAFMCLARKRAHDFVVEDEAGSSRRSSSCWTLSRG